MTENDQELQGVPYQERPTTARMGETWQGLERLAGSLKDELEKLRAEFDGLRRERDEYLEMARRVQAEFSNYRKRIARDNSELLERAGEGLVERLMPLLDALDAASQHHPQVIGPIQRGLRAALESEGLKRLEPVGEVFDPAVAEAVEHAGDGEVQVVGEVRRPGYRWKGRLIRPALVRVESRSAAARATEASSGVSDPSSAPGGQTSPGAGEQVPVAG